jgi:hypothetical protein
LPIEEIVMTTVTECCPDTLEKRADPDTLPFADVSFAPALTAFARQAIVNARGILHHIVGALLNAMHESRWTQAEREIAHYVALRGGRLTDDLQGEITRRLFTSNWGPPGIGA